MADRVGGTFHILCICTGNICRSPVAERLLATRLDQSVSVSSAGTFGLTGRTIEAPMVRYLSGMSVGSETFLARRLDPTLLRGADLVLGMTREHRGAAVELHPAGVRSAFTLLEFTRLLGTIAPGELPAGTAADRLRAAVPLAARRRRGWPGDADDVVDPYGLAEDVFESAFRSIRLAVDAIGDRIVRQPG